MDTIVTHYPQTVDTCNVFQRFLSNILETLSNFLIFFDKSGYELVLNVVFDEFCEQIFELFFFEGINCLNIVQSISYSFFFKVFYNAFQFGKGKLWICSFEPQLQEAI